MHRSTSRMDGCRVDPKVTLCINRNGERPTLVDLTGPTPIEYRWDPTDTPRVETATRSLEPAVAKSRSATKRQKRSVSDDLICPITHELPINPVHAEDGRLYEREAMEKHISMHRTGLKSPMTGERMGKKLHPAPHITNMIECLIENGDIDGDLATQWQDKKNSIKEQKSKMDDWLRKAQNGDTEAMIELGVLYEIGCDGVPKNPKDAFKWYERAHTAGSVQGTAYLGDAYCIGLGVKKDSASGLGYYFEAAERGSDFAAHFLGMAFADGMYGLPQDRDRAEYWLETCINKCEVEHMDISDQDEAYAMLEKLEELKRQK